MLEDRLRTRFCWGLTVNIFPPDFTLRTEILKKKIIAGNFETEIPDDVVEYIASNIGTDVRQLEGYSCCTDQDETNFSFIDNEVKKRLIEKKLRYYRVGAMPNLPNDQSYSAG